MSEENPSVKIDTNQGDLKFDFCMNEESTITLSRNGAKLSGNKVYLVGKNGSGKSTLLANIRNIVPESIPFESVLSNRQNFLNLDRTDPEHVLVQNKNFTQRYQSSRTDHDKFSKSIISCRIKKRIQSQSLENFLESGMSTEDFNKQSALYKINKLLKTINIKEISSFEGSSIFSKEKDCDKKHNLSMQLFSDGEKAAIIFIMHVLTCEDKSIFYVDEPELHLHPSISKQLLAALFEERPDCVFIISTHDLSLPQKDDPILILRGCEWKDSNPKKFNVDLVKASEIPEDIRVDILGSRENIIFVEGKGDGSLDKRLYEILFPEFSIIQKNGCEEVIKAAKGVFNTERYHRVNGFGIIDNDSRDETDIQKLNEDKIFPLQIYAIESMYYHHIAIEKMKICIPDKKKNHESDLLRDPKTAFLEHLKKTDGGVPKKINEMCSIRCERSAKNAIKLPTSEDFEKGENLNITVSFEGCLEKEKKELKKLIINEDYKTILNKYKIKGLEQPILNAFNISKKEYEKKFLEIVEGDENFQDAILKELGLQEIKKSSTAQNTSEQSKAA